MQLRIAPPGAWRFGEPDFAHYADLPVITAADGSAWVACPGDLRLARPRSGWGCWRTCRSGVPEITLSAAGRCRFFVVGGVPLGEKLVMRWDFVGRTGEEIATARNAWVAGEFGEVVGYDGEPLAAPPLPPGGLIAR